MMVVKDLGVDGYSRWHRMYGSYSQQSTFSHKSSLLGVASIAVSHQLQSHINCSFCVLLLPISLSIMSQLIRSM